MEPRPHSLAEIATRASNGNSFEFELAGFLHEFKLRGGTDMLSAEPVSLTGSSAMGAIHDAYLAAVAVYLSARLNSPSPSWVRKPERILPEPWFANPGRHMRALLLVESPAAFRERNLFVTANALSVA